MDTKVHEMTFAQFAEAVKPSAGINRWPRFGGNSEEMVSYSVYMNGDLTSQIPEQSRDHEFRDVAVHALTEKLGLDSNSYRDNLKVAQLVATRHAYMASILEASFTNELAPAIQAEYEHLTKELSHPYILQQLEEQRALSLRLVPVLEDARKSLGWDSLREAPAGGVNKGAIVSQSLDFTVQDIGGGRIVAHENQNLDKVPTIGQDVTVTYYRGKGQVIENIKEMQFSKPYIDEKSEDIAVNIMDMSGKVKQVVLFNSMAMVAEFANEHGLGKGMVQEAMAVREEHPKRLPQRPERSTIGNAYLDGTTGCIAVDYKEGQVTYTAVFDEARDLEQNAHHFNASKEVVKSAFAMEHRRNEAEKALIDLSYREATKIAQHGFDSFSSANKGNGVRHGGQIVASTALHVVQDAGRSSAVIHDKRDLDKVPYVGERATIAYNGKRAEVAIKDVSQDRNKGVGRV